LTLRRPYCVVTGGSVTSRRVTTSRHRHKVTIDNAGGIGLLSRVGRILACRLVAMESTMGADVPSTAGYVKEEHEMGSWLPSGDRDNLDVQKPSPVPVIESATFVTEEETIALREGRLGVQQIHSGSSWDAAERRNRRLPRTVEVLLAAVV
jgi:hypothetical protein